MDDPVSLKGKSEKEKDRVVKGKTKTRGGKGGRREGTNE